MRFPLRHASTGVPPTGVEARADPEALAPMACVRIPRLPLPRRAFPRARPRPMLDRSIGIPPTRPPWLPFSALAAPVTPALMPRA